MSEWVCLELCFGGARKYVTDGLPVDHYIRSELDNNANWADQDDYSTYPSAVLSAARFRDGLVMDSIVYPEFRNEFSNIWADEFKKQSEVVFRHLLSVADPPEVLTMCPAAGDHLCSAEGLCDTAEFQLRLMQYHLRNVEGMQSQSYMRDKVLLLLGTDIHSLPKTMNSKDPSAKCKMKYVHSLCVVLYTLVREQMWLQWKIYGPEDFVSTIDACRRAHTVMASLIKCSTFDHPQLYKVFINLCECVKSLEDLNDDLDTRFDLSSRFFPGKALLQYENHAATLKAKYGDWKEKEEEETEEEEEEEKNADAEGGANAFAEDAENQSPNQAAAAAAAAASVSEVQPLGKRAGAPASAAAAAAGKRMRSNE